MTEVYGSCPTDIVAQIGPGISLDSFEVGDEVYDAFNHAVFDMSSISERRDKWHIDLPECNRQQLMAAGVAEAHISVADICTVKHAETFFSARRLGIESGRIFTGIVCKQR
jgi:copper oxidase (laccase) domain-containing protein